MTLVDTSVWINHLKRGDPALAQLLVDDDVATHPFVEGELLLAGAPVEVLLGGVRRLDLAAHPEVAGWARRLGAERLRGVGWIDLHLAFTARVSGCSLLTYDRKLMRLALG